VGNKPHSTQGRNAMTKKQFVFRPVGMDIFDRRPHQPKEGTVVVKCQPAGTPKNGTMGHCFVEDAETGEFYGLVLVKSLQPVA
jgi:hypothetical protein